MNYNLLATCEPINVSRACGELWINLRAAGDDAPRVNRSKVKGLILSRTFLDPVKAIHELRLLMEKQPNRFKMVNRVMPILGWVQTDVPSIVEGVRVQSTRIQKEESFRVTLEKRRTGLGSLEIIEPVAEVIERRVDLENPDWVVLIEVVGNETGVSVIRLNDVLNVLKEIYALSHNRH